MLRTLHPWKVGVFPAVNARSPVQLLAFITCDGIHIDPLSGKHTILGVFSTLHAERFPVVHPRMIWFLTIMDASVGPHRLKITLGLPTEEPRTVVEREFDSKSPAQRINLINDIQNLRFKAPGDYTVVVEIDDEQLLVTSFPVTGS